MSRLDPKVLRFSRDAPQHPPRLTGDYAADMSAMQEWMKQLYSSLINSGLGDPLYQSAEVEIDPEALPAPKLTTIARAQATANLAHVRLTAAEETISAQAATIAAQNERIGEMETRITDLEARVTALETP